MQQPVWHPDNGGSKKYSKEDRSQRCFVVSRNLGWRPAEVWAEGDPIIIDEVTHRLTQVGEAALFIDDDFQPLQYECADERVD